MIKLPAVTGSGWGSSTEMRPFELFELVSLSPVLSPLSALLFPGAGGVTCDDSTGGAVTIGAAFSTETFGETAGEKVGSTTITGVLRALFFLRFELFF